MKSMLDKKKVLEKYLKGYTATEIAEMMNIKRDTIIKSLYRYKSKLTKEQASTIDWTHKDNRVQLKDIIRTEKRLASQFMTTANLIKFNRQSFSSTKNGGLKFDEDRGAKPADLPKYYRKSL